MDVSVVQKLVSSDSEDAHALLKKFLGEDLIESIAERSAIKADQSYDDDESSRAIVVKALKCLCNLIFNSPTVAAICSKNGTIEGIVYQLKLNRI